MWCKRDRTWPQLGHFLRHLHFTLLHVGQGDGAGAVAGARSMVGGTDAGFGTGAGAEAGTGAVDGCGCGVGCGGSCGVDVWSLSRKAPPECVEGIPTWWCVTESNDEGA